MKDYTLNAVSVTLDGNTFMEKEVARQIPTSLVQQSNVCIMPTILYNTLINEINNGNDNYAFVNSFIEIVKVLYKNEGKETYSTELKNINSDYSTFLKLIRPAILKTDYPTFNKESKIKDHATIHTMRNYSDLTFLTLKDKKDYGIIDINFAIDSLENTPLNNDTFINTLSNVTIDAASAINAEFQYINSNKFINEYGSDKDKYKVFIFRVTAILNMLTYRWAKKGKCTDRVFSTFSSLSKISRKYVKLNGKAFYEIDIKNCQPLLLVILANENNLILDENYIHDVQSGVFYDKLMKEAEILGYTEEYIFDKKVTKDVYYEGLVIDTKPVAKLKKYSFLSRENVKVLCYNDIFFASKITNTHLVKIFKNLYPKTLEAVITLSNNDQSFALKMQILEADLVLNIIPNCAYFPVHDAIYITNKMEINNVKKQLINTIYNRSGGTIKNVTFGEIIEHKLEIIDNNNIVIIETPIKERALHSGKQIKMNAFIKMMEQGMSQTEIIDVLKISYKTFIRYKKELILA